MKQSILMGIAICCNTVTYAQSITIPYDAAVVAVDGTMNSAEWNNSSKIAIKVSASDSVNVYYKHDMNALYMAYTGKLESANALFPEVLIDAQFAKGNAWINGQWWFHVSATDCENNGAYGVYNNCLLVQSDWDGANNFTAGLPNTDTVEIRIPFSKINFNPATQSEIGIVFLVTNTANVWKLWPPVADRNIPATWAIATVSKFPVDISQVPGKSIKVYPNPAHTLLMLEDVKAHSEIRITDVMGRVILQQYYEAQPIAISSLPRGMYYVQVYEQGKRVVKQVMQKL